VSRFWAKGNASNSIYSLSRNVQKGLENNGLMCIERCPNNMIDDGILCQKPLIQRRQFISKTEISKITRNNNINANNSTIERLKKDYK